MAVIEQDSNPLSEFLYALCYMNRLNKTILYFVSAFSTGIAGILHLVLVPNSINAGIEYAAFLLISGMAQLFWVLPMIKQWGTIWYIIGIGGTVIMVGLTGYTLASIAADPQSAPHIDARATLT